MKEYDKFVKRVNKTDTVTVFVEKSERLSLTASEINNELKYMDTVVLPNGDSYLVTQANDTEVELMKQNRTVLTKEQVKDFIRNAFIDRAECFS